MIFLYILDIFKNNKQMNPFEWIQHTGQQGSQTNFFLMNFHK